MTGKKGISLLIPIIALAFLLGAFHVASAQEKGAIDKWIKEFQPSSLTQEAQRKELEWFQKAAKPYVGMKIKSVAEDIQTHRYESEVIAKAFKEITGIEVSHDIIGEGDVVQRLQTQIASKKTIYHAYVNDSDLKGTHLRKQTCIVLSDYIKGEGKGVTNPYLDLEDWLNLEFGQDYDGKQMQLADQTFPILYWFRYDLFTDPKYKKMFKDKYGYELGVPVNWAAYEDIANFWTNDVKTIDGKPIYGHLDYGKKGASLGWRFSDAWLSLAGTGSKGLPNGLPVDEWGIRVEDRIPVGSMVERGGQLNSPAAIYALAKYVEWLKKYAPPYAAGIEWSEVGPIPGNGEIAQTIYFCGTFISYPNYSTPGSPVCDANGNPKWRLAPQPRGKYWEKGMKVGYQDAGSWTILTDVKGKERAAAWLWCQFAVSKSVSLKKVVVGNTPFRLSDLHAAYWTPEREKRYGGLLDWYRGPMRKLFTDTGLNVPDYPLLQEQWWHAISLAVTGEKTPAEAMQGLAETTDRLMGRLKLPKYSPKLNPLKDKEYWFSQPDGPKREMTEREKPETIDYDSMVKLWKEGKIAP
jgi:glycerol transport system substrate-binding protein